MSILPSHLEAMAAEKAKARRRNPLARTSSHTGSQSDISLAPPLVAGSPNRGGISPRASREPSPFGEIELPVPTDSSPPRSPAVVAYSDKNNARRRSTTVGTGIQDGWLERQMKLLKKRGWTMSMLAWRGAALMTVVLYLLWKWKMPSERDIDGLTMPADQISNFGGHFGGQHQFVDGYLKTHEGSHGKHPIWELLNHVRFLAFSFRKDPFHTPASPLCSSADDVLILPFSIGPLSLPRSDPQLAYERESLGFASLSG
jgi:hypothetical protein